MRKLLGELLFESMQKDKKLWLLTGDLGFGVLNKCRDNFSDRFYNVGAAEQLMLGTAVGLSHNEQIPICYSITPFILFRPYEYIRNYLNKENASVKLIGAGRDKDYGNLGFSHWAVDDEVSLKHFDNLIILKPNTENDLKEMWEEFLYNNKPCYLNVQR